MGFEHHHGEWCVGTNLRAFKKLTRRACADHCNSAACVCYQYKEELVDGNCRFTLAHEFVAIKKSRVGFDAFLREGATAQGAGAGVLAGGPHNISSGHSRAFITPYGALVQDCGAWWEHERYAVSYATSDYRAEAVAKFQTFARSGTFG